MEQVHILRVVVASPGDVQAERDSVEEVAQELNRGIAAYAGLQIKVVRWETDAFPGFHVDGPQGLIDPILGIEDSDVLIGIFWKRFGTPVSDAGSGTEHEFRKAYTSWKASNRPQIMMYFNKKSFLPSTQQELEQFGKILVFQKDFPKEGLWWSYNGRAQFVKLLRNHLTQFILHQKLSTKMPPAGDAPVVPSTSSSHSARAADAPTLDMKALRDALSQTDAMRNPITRAQVLGRLPSEILYQLPNPIPGSNLANIVDDIVTTCNRFEGGIETLVDSVRQSEGPTKAMRQLDGLF